MGRNGTKAPAFTRTVLLLSQNYGQTLRLSDMLFGKEPDRGAEMAYVYKFLKLGYIKKADDKKIRDPEALYTVVRELSPAYTSCDMKRELKALDLEAEDLM